MRIVFAGGGTGGHLFPGLSVAQELARQEPDARIIFFGTSRKIEETVKKHGFDLSEIGPERRRSGIYGTMCFIVQLGVSFLRSLTRLKRFEPDVLIGLGGYGSAGPAMAARVRGIPLVLLEQNALPGRANRLLCRWADQVHCQWQVSTEYFSRAETVHVSGNPVRADIGALDKKEARRRLRLPEDAKVLLVMGGSQGAHAINQTVLENLDALSDASEQIAVIHLTGSTDFDRAAKIYDEADISGQAWEFMNEMPVAYAASDLAICRAGATTCAELTCAGLPAVLIPFPFAKDDHQTKNAEILVQGGAAILVRENEFSRAKIIEILGLLEDDKKLKEMRSKAKALAQPEAAEKIAQHIMELVRTIDTS